MLLAIQIILFTFDFITGILAAWSRGEPIRAAFARRKIFDKFEDWKWVLIIVMVALLIHQEQVARVVMLYILLPEFLLVIENIKASVQKRQET